MDYVGSRNKVYDKNNEGFTKTESNSIAKSETCILSADTTQITNKFLYMQITGVHVYDDIVRISICISNMITNLKYILKT